jgi:hypothetical protein
MRDAGATGEFRIGDTTINRLGYSAMRITGPGIWGPPSDRAAALATLRRLPELGVNFIDTADSYGPDVSEMLIREALHPYDRLLDRHEGRPEAARPPQHRCLLQQRQCDPRVDTRQRERRCSSVAA